MKEEMEELLKLARERNCEQHFYSLFYKVMSFSFEYGKSVESEIALSHAKWALEIVSSEYENNKKMPFAEDI